MNLIINDNNLASYFLFVGSDGLMNEIIESQYETKWKYKSKYDNS